MSAAQNGFSSEKAFGHLFSVGAQIIKVKDVGYVIFAGGDYRLFYEAMRELKKADYVSYASEGGRGFALTEKYRSIKVGDRAGVIMTDKAADEKFPERYAEFVSAKAVINAAVEPRDISSQLAKGIIIGAETPR